MMADVRLREVMTADLDLFFEHQCDTGAQWMAAFTAKEPSDRAAFDNHWARILADDSILIRAVIVAEQVAGHVLIHRAFGQPEVSYWIGRAFWGHGVATAALQGLLQIESERPVRARVAADNLGSIRVLKKCGFEEMGADKGFANARQTEIDELVLVLGEQRRNLK